MRSLILSSLATLIALPAFALPHGLKREFDKSIYSTSAVLLLCEKKIPVLNPNASGYVEFNRSCQNLENGYEFFLAGMRDSTSEEEYLLETIVCT